MKILVTGACGFIGQHLISAFGNNKAFGKTNHDVVGLDLESGWDVRDRHQVFKTFELERFDMVIHLAALTGVRRGEEFPKEYIDTNVLGTKNIVDACEQYNIIRLINFSSSSVYGDHANHGKKLESWPCEPKSIYGISKLMAEKIVNRAKMETFNVRPFTVYGKNGRQDQVMMRWIGIMKEGRMVPVYAGGKKNADHIRRGYTHVNDLIDGVMAILALPFKGLPFEDPRHETINLGGDKSVSLLDLIGIFLLAIPDFKYQYFGRQPGDVRTSIGDTTHARHLLGWEPKMDFEKEVKRIIKEGMKS